MGAAGAAWRWLGHWTGGQRPALATTTDTENTNLRTTVVAVRPDQPRFSDFPGWVLYWGLLSRLICWFAICRMPVDAPNVKTVEARATKSPICIEIVARTGNMSFKTIVEAKRGTGVRHYCFRQFGTRSHRRVANRQRRPLQGPSLISLDAGRFLKIIVGTSTHFLVPSTSLYDRS